MKRICFVFTAFCWLSFNVTFAQKQFNGVVSGTIVEKESNKPIEFAQVVIRMEPDTSKITGTATDAKGKFKFENLSKGNYSIIYSFIGFEKKKSSKFLVDEQHIVINLGTLGLSATNHELGEVSITGKKSTYVNSIDRKVFNVGDDMKGPVSEVEYAYSS